MMMNRIFSAVRNYDCTSANPKICKTCDQPATKDFLFNVGNGITVIERYCDHCAVIMSANKDN